MFYLTLAKCISRAKTKQKKKKMGRNTIKKKEFSYVKVTVTAVRILNSHKSEVIFVYKTVNIKIFQTVGQNRFGYELTNRLWPRLWG